MKQRTSILTLTFAAILLSAPLANANIQKIWRPGEYVASEDAYFAGNIEDEAGLIKAHKFVTPTDNKYSTQKTRGLGSNIIGNIENVWENYTGKGTTVAVLDDGFDYLHPEYQRSDGTSAILSTSRYYYANGNTAYYKSYSNDPTCIAEDWEEDDENPSNSEWASHGTATSTTAAAPMGNGGGVGIAPEADILALKIDFSFAAIEAAIAYAIEQKVDVINMSLGAYSEIFTDGWGDTQRGSSSSATYLNSVCNRAYNAGIIVIAAAGNEATWHKSYPACNSHVVGVGALGLWDQKNKEDSLAAFTNYVSTSQTGEINVDILAPGYVYTAHQKGTQSSPTHSYADTQGTSFSCPTVAGAACLWKEKFPSGTPDQFLQDLQESASDIGAYKNKMVPVSDWYDELTDVGPSNIECGRLNVENLLKTDEPYVDVKQSSIAIAIGEGKQIELNSHSGDISYSSANTAIATVNATGRVVGVSKGSTNITVTATLNEQTASVNVPVTVSDAVATTSLSIDPDSVSLKVGDTYEIEPTVVPTPSNASRVFLYESADESIAEVDMETGTLTAVGVGATTIVIMPLDGQGEATLSVTVSEASTTWQRVENNSGLVVGDEYTFGLYASGKVCGPLGTNKYLSAVDATFESAANLTSLPEAAESFILGQSGSYYTLKQKTTGQLLGFNNNKDLLNGSGTTNWSISVSSGIATITGGDFLLTYNSGSPRWKTYATDFSGKADFSLYHKPSAPAVAVTGVTVSPTTLSLNEGETSQLTATVAPSNATNKNATWSSGNAQIATVSSNGLVTAIKAGSTNITVTTEDGSFTATCVVTVTTDRYIDHLTATYTGSDLYVGDSLNPANVSVTATFTNSSKYPDAILSSGSYSLTGFDSSSVGNKTVTVTYTGDYAVTTSPMTTTFSVLVKEDVVAVVTPSVSKVFHPGETIAKSDITVTLTYESGKTATTTEFSFANDGYMFTYEDTIPGQETTKAFSIVCSGQTYAFNARVARKAYTEPQSTSATITGNKVKNAGVTGTGASGKADYNNLVIDGITYAATNVYVYTKNNTSHISFGMGVGEIHNVTPFAAPLSAISFSRASNARTDEVVYVATNGSDWVKLSQTSLTQFNYRYLKVAYETESSSYSNISSINLTFRGVDTASSISNFIMLADTEGQCTTKLSQAIAKLNAMSQSEAELFWSSNDYVIATARERLEAWAASQGVNLDYVDGAFVTQANASSSMARNHDANPWIIIAAVSFLGLASFAGLFIAKRKKEN